MPACAPATSAAEPAATVIASGARRVSVEHRLAGIAIIRDLFAGSGEDNAETTTGKPMHKTVAIRAAGIATARPLATT